MYYLELTKYFPKTSTPVHQIAIYNVDIYVAIFVVYVQFLPNGNRYLIRTNVNYIIFIF